MIYTITFRMNDFMQLTLLNIDRIAKSINHQFYYFFFQVTFYYCTISLCLYGLHGLVYVPVEFTHILQGFSMALGQSYCPSASEATLKDMGK